MPNLIKIEDFNNIRYFNNFYPRKLEPFFYFPDAYYNSRHEIWEFDVKKSHPYTSFAHVDHVKDDPLFFINMRKFVERSASGDVIVQLKNLSYKWCWNARRAKNQNDREFSDIQHSYWEFNFEFQEDLDMWKLKSNIMTDIPAKYHPDRTDHTDFNCVQLSKI